MTVDYRLQRYWREAQGLMRGSILGTLSVRQKRTAWRRPIGWKRSRGSSLRLELNKVQAINVCRSS
jgi:hypothetical protein